MQLVNNLYEYCKVQWDICIVLINVLLSILVKNIFTHKAVYTMVSNSIAGRLGIYVKSPPLIKVRKKTSVVVIVHVLL